MEVMNHKFYETISSNSQFNSSVRQREWCKVAKTSAYEFLIEQRIYVIDVAFKQLY